MMGCLKYVYWLFKIKLCRAITITIKWTRKVHIFRSYTNLWHQKEELLKHNKAKIYITNCGQKYTSRCYVHKPYALYNYSSAQFNNPSELLIQQPESQMTLNRSPECIVFVYKSFYKVKKFPSLISFFPVQVLRLL